MRSDQLLMFLNVDAALHILYILLILAMIQSDKNTSRSLITAFRFSVFLLLRLKKNKNTKKKKLRKKHRLLGLVLYMSLFIFISSHKVL